MFTPIKITEKALREIKNICKKKQIPAEYGLRVGARGGGCGGLSFILGFDTQKPEDGVYQIDDLAVLIEKKDTMYLVGVTIDWIERDQEKGFTFIRESALQRS